MGSVAGVTYAFLIILAINEQRSIDKFPENYLWLHPGMVNIPLTDGLQDWQLLPGLSSTLHVRELPDILQNDAGLE